MSTRGLIVFFAVLLALAIFAISALPTQTKHALHIQGALHPWLHLLGFALLTLLLLSSTRSVAVRVLLVVAVLLLGYGTEARESRKDGWPIEQKDLRTDAFGVALGTLAAALLNRVIGPADRTSTN